MSRQTYRFVNATRGGLIAPRVEKAGSFAARLAGLIGRRALAGDEGLWLVPCNGVHTFGMRFALDIIVLDRELRVLRVHRRVPPNRLLWPARGGHSVLELAAGTLEMVAVQPGDQLEGVPEHLNT